MKKKIIRKVRKLPLDTETLRRLVLGGGPDAALAPGETVNVSQCPQYCTNWIDQCPIVT